MSSALVPSPPPTTSFSAPAPAPENSEPSLLPPLPPPLPPEPPLFNRDTWRMPPLDRLPPARLSPLSRIWMIVLRGYLVVAGGLVLLRIFQLATVGA